MMHTAQLHCWLLSNTRCHLCMRLALGPTLISSGLEPMTMILLPDLRPAACVLGMMVQSMRVVTGLQGFANWQGFKTGKPRAWHQFASVPNSSCHASTLHIARHATP